MADSEDVFDDLDAFFSAASGDNPDELQQAAQHVAGTKGVHGDIAGPGAGPRIPQQTADPAPHTATPAGELQEVSADDLNGKFIAIDPEALHDETAVPASEPFILIPANIHAFLPWWGWLSIGLGLVMLVAGVIIAPYINLNRLASKLGDANEANAQYAMRQLVIRGDERTVGKLYDMASSGESPMSARLRAVDTLGLINAPQADRALQRLELAGSTNEKVREAAIAARKQKEASRSRGRR